MLFAFSVNKIKQMKATSKIIAGFGLAAMVGLSVYLLRRQKTKRRKRQVAAFRDELVAEHGYETAHDILFPRHYKRSQKSKG